MYAYDWISLTYCCLKCYTRLIYTNNSDNNNCTQFFNTERNNYIVGASKYIGWTRELSEGRLSRILHV